MISGKTVFSSKTSTIILTSIMLFGIVSFIIPQITSQAYALETPEYLSQFGSPGTANGEFSAPTGIAIDSSNNLYVMENGNWRIQKFSDQGVFERTWGSLCRLFNGGVGCVDPDGPGTAFVLGDGQFADPFGIAVDIEDRVYASDKNNRRIQIFDSDGNFLSKFGYIGSTDGRFQLNRDVAVAIVNNDPNPPTAGNIYVADSGNHRIQVFDSDGNFLFKFGSLCTQSGIGCVDPDGPGTTFELGDGQFDNPRGIQIASNGNVYISDWDNHRIQVFDSDGNFLTKFGKNGGNRASGNGDGEFVRPYGMAFDSNGNLYVTDSYNHRVQVFDSNHDYLTQFGTSGSDDGEFTFPVDVVIHKSSGEIYVVDVGNARIQVFEIPTVTPVITFNQAQYEIEHGGIITVDYAPGNTDSGVSESINVNLTSDIDPTGISVLLRETGDDTGVFKSTSYIKFTTTPSPNIVSIETSTTSGNDQIYASYLGQGTTQATIIPITSVPPTGTAFNIITAVGCSDDQDVDGICDAWENGDNESWLFIAQDDQDATDSGYTLNDNYEVLCSYVPSSGPAFDDGWDGCPSDSVKDIYLELDYMSNHQPDLTTVIDPIINAFWSNPVERIQLHVQVDEDLGYHEDETSLSADGSGISNFDDIKKLQFGTNIANTEVTADRTRTDDAIKLRANFFHYGLIAHDQPGGAKGSSGFAELLGNDFMVTLGSFEGGVGSAAEQSATIMHELGHNVNLKHGGPNDNVLDTGDDEDNCKPNYLSIMNYAYQTPEYVSDRPLDYSGTSSPVPVDLSEDSIDEGFEFDTQDTRWTKFAHGNGDSNNVRVTSSLPDDSNPTTGVDWDGSTTIDGVVNNANINNFGIGRCNDAVTISTLKSLNDWANLDLIFQAEPVFDDGLHTHPSLVEELSIDIVKQMRSSLLGGLQNIIQSLPDSAFSDPVSDRQTFTDDITTIDEFITQDDLDFATTLLQFLREKLDGSAGGNPSDDLILDGEAQAQILPIIDNILASWDIATTPSGESHIDESTPQQRKQQIITQLEALESQAQQNKTQKEINKAIKDIQKSLKPNYWISEERLDAKKGEKVFKEDKDAIKRLMKIIDKDKESSEFLTLIQQIIDELVDVDRVLAQTAINDAQVFAGDPKADKEIAKANKEMEKAQKELDKDKPDKAIKHYEKAWKHAQHAMKHQTDDDDDDDDDDDE